MRALVPAEPLFSVTGTVAPTRLRSEERVIQVAHQRRARSAAGHLLGRTAHIDVDDFGAPFREARAFGHPARLAPGELHRIRGGAVRLGAPAREMRFPSASAPEAVITEITRPAPKSDAMRRNGAGVTPDIGASRTRLGNGTGPTNICSLFDISRLLCTGTCPAKLSGSRRAMDRINREPSLRLFHRLDVEIDRRSPRRRSAPERIPALGR